MRIILIYLVDSANVSVREMIQLIRAYVDYRKHPCLANYSLLINYLDDLSGHIEQLESLKEVDFLNVEN